MTPAQITATVNRIAQAARPDPSGSCSLALMPGVSHGTTPTLICWSSKPRSLIGRPRRCGCGACYGRCESRSISWCIHKRT